MASSVEDYGADPAAADNTEAFNRAAHEAGARASGGLILIPTGDYRIAGTIRTPPNAPSVRFVGETNQGSRLLHTGPGRLIDLTYAYRGSGLEHLSLIGGPHTECLLYLGASSENYFGDLWLDGGQGTTERGGTIGVHLDGSRGPGDLGGGCYGNVLERLVIEDCGIGIYFSSRPDPEHPAPMLIAANRVRDTAIRPRKFKQGENQLTGINCYNANACQFTGLDIEQLGYGVRLGGGCADIMLEHCYNQHGCDYGDLREIVFDDTTSQVYVWGGQIGNPSGYAAHPQVCLFAQGNLTMFGQRAAWQA